MLTSLYSELFKYRSHDRHEQLENFCTEALAGILRRMSVPEQVRFITDVLLRRSTNDRRTQFLARLDAPYKLEWRTQEAISIKGSSNYVDLILNDSRGPLLYIECKVKAPIDEAQLIRYGKHLEKQDETAYLVLLTSESREPDGFLDNSGNDRYGEVGRGVTRWQYIFEAFQNWIHPENNTPDAFSSGLREEFCNFMEVLAMASNSPEFKDFQTVSKAIADSSILRIYNSFFEIAEAVESLIADQKIGRIHKNDNWEEGYLERYWKIDDIGWTISVLFDFVSQQDDLGHICVCLCPPDESPQFVQHLSGRSNRNPSWQYSLGNDENHVGAYRYKPFAELLNNSGTFTAHAADWAKDAASHALNLHKNLFSNGIPI